MRGLLRMGVREALNDVVGANPEQVLPGSVARAAPHRGDVHNVVQKCLLVRAVGLRGPSIEDGPLPWARMTRSQNFHPAP